MSEIKFRVWNELSGTMENTSVGEGKYLKLSRHTGLRDKNGKEIYEGDVLQYPDSEIIEVVKWVSNKWTDGGYITGFGEFTFTPDQYEIVGNIHENPEL